MSEWQALHSHSITILRSDHVTDYKYTEISTAVQKQEWGVKVVDNETVWNSTPWICNELMQRFNNADSQDGIIDED
jgi:hypothetical protein